MKNILNITNLTDTPREDIRERTNEAILAIEERGNIHFTEEQKNHAHDYIDGMIEDFEKNGKVSEAMSFVDNLIVNFDYYAFAKGIYEGDI